jgi:antirestriction protein
MKFFANPYNTGATGFYFETYDDFVEKSTALRDNCGNVVEEYEIDVIDGEQNEVQLVSAIGVDQANLESVIEYIDTSDEHEWPALYFLVNELNLSFEIAKDKVDEVCLTEMPLNEAATEFFDEVYLNEVPESVRNYIDYKAFARDLRLASQFVEFEFAGDTFTCTNADAV